jgi:long-chain acyl-CoA synthetase
MTLLVGAAVLCAACHDSPIAPTPRSLTGRWSGGLARSPCAGDWSEVTLEIAQAASALNGQVVTKDGHRFALTGPTSGRVGRHSPPPRERLDDAAAPPIAVGYDARRLRARMHNFYEQFTAAALRFPDRPAIEVQRRERVDTFTYRRLETMAARMAAWLAARGVSRGDRCAILAENDAHWCGAYLGALRLGAVAVPLDTAYKAGQVARLAKDCQPRVIFTSPRHVDTVLEARAQSADAPFEVVLLHGEHADLPRAEAVFNDESLPEPPPCPASIEEMAVILYTSGTTSDPKGVVLTHGNLLAEREAAFKVVTVTEHDCILGVLPLFHALAQMANLLLPFSIGARVVFLETVNTTELLRGLAERGVTLFACVPQFFYLIHQRVTHEVARASWPKRRIFHGLLALNGGLRRVGINAGPVVFGKVHRVLGRQMRFLITGGSRFDPLIGRDLYRMGFDILQAYGLTETSGAATVMHPGDDNIHTVGPVLPGSEVRILPPDTTDDSMADGEILIRGPIVMAGYYNRPDATAAALQDGWLHTGDLGRLDGGGRLIITGRKKELIVLSSGKNIYPEEIEAHYRQSPVIKELCVLGVARPGEPSAERLYAVVVPDADVLRERKVVNTGDLVRFEMEGRSVGLPAHKRVLGYEVWMEPLPRTTTGKLKRFEIERRVTEAAATRAVGAVAPVSEAEREWAEAAEVAPILAVIARAARDGAPARAEANLELDLGLDSMERVELLTDLEQRFAAKVPEEDAQRIFTVRELVEAIRTHGTGAVQGTGASAWATILASDPPADQRLADILGPKTVPAIVQFAILWAAMLLARVVVRFDVRGLEHLPASGPYLITPNHQSYLDSFFLMGSLPWRIFRQVFFVGASEYFETPFMRWFARQVNVVPVDPDSSLVPAMQAGGFGLRHGRVLVLFPEGERSIDGTVKSFKKGAAILSQHLSAPIVPVALDGIYEIWPRNRPIAWGVLRPWRRAPVAIHVGPPLPAPRPIGAGDALPEGAYEALTTALRDRIDAMWRAAHRPS